MTEREYQFPLRIIIERRENGGLRVYSDDIPGFVLSHADAEKVLMDIGPALVVFLSVMKEDKGMSERVWLNPVEAFEFACNHWGWNWAVNEQAALQEFGRRYAAGQSEAETTGPITQCLAPERRTPVPPEATGDEGKAVDIEWLLDGIQWTEPKETNGVRIGILAAFAKLQEERDDLRISLTACHWAGRMERDEAKMEIDNAYQRGWADAMERARVRIDLLGLVTVFTDFEKGYHRALVDAACDIRAEPLPTAEPPAAQQK